MLKKGELQVSADFVVKLGHSKSIELSLPGERRWVVSYPQQLRRRRLEQEGAFSRRFKGMIRMFNAARNRVVDKVVLTTEDATSHFLEFLLYSAARPLLEQTLAPTFVGALNWLKTTRSRILRSNTGNWDCSVCSRHNGQSKQTCNP